MTTILLFVLCIQLIVNIAINHVTVKAALKLVCKDAHLGHKFFIELGDIMTLLFIVLLKCHDNQNRRESLNIVISAAFCHLDVLETCT